MTRRTNVLRAGIAALAILTAPIGAGAQAGSPPANAAPVPVTQPAPVSSLVVKPHQGEEAVDVDGHAGSQSVVTITLVSTFSQDLPDVVLSRTYVDTDAFGGFSTVISIAPGFTRGTFITVYAVAAGSGQAVKALYNVQAPNHGVVVPLDKVPREVW